MLLDGAGKKRFATKSANSGLMRCNKMIGETQNYRASLVH